MKICYLTLTTSVPTRDAVYLQGLRNLSVEILECRDYTPGIKKFWHLWQKHQALHDDYDALLVGYAGHILVPFARLISKKKIVFNALGSLTDGVIGSRKKYGFLGWRVIYCWIVDWLAFNAAHVSLLDTQARKNYIKKKFFIADKKLLRFWTGVDDSIFKYDPTVSKLPVFTVLFRGALMPEASIEHFLQAAHLLRNESVRFRIIGSGFDTPLVTRMLKDLQLQNVEWIQERLEWNDLIKKMLECHVSVSQLSDHERQNFHVPFKTIESMALKLPYLLTNTSYGILEFMTDGQTCLCFKPADPKDLAEKITYLKQNPEKLASIAQNAYDLFQKEFSTSVLGKNLRGLIIKLSNE